VKRWAALLAPVAAAIAVGLSLSTTPSRGALEREVGLPAGVTCHGAGRGSVVLLVPGTGQRADESWGATFAPALARDGNTPCLIELPGASLGDIGETARVVAAAIRALAARSHRPIDVVGHSQGGLDAAWALHENADLPPLVDDLITLGTPWRGLPGADASCVSTCAVAIRQMAAGSLLLAALARDGVAAPVVVTSIAADDDTIVPPEAAAADAVVQHRCTGGEVGHAGLLTDAATYALVRAALDDVAPPATAC
jgi:pimeloyl-ACP methyl ester carboxylesterase